MKFQGVSEKLKRKWFQRVSGVILKCLAALENSLKFTETPMKPLNETSCKPYEAPEMPLKLPKLLATF